MENSLSTMSLDTLVNKLIDLSVSFGSKLLVALLVFFIGRWIVKKLNRLVINILTKRHVEASLATFTKSLVSITLNFTLVIIIISVLGIETSSFIALFASAGVAVGMALSGNLSNFAGGLIILLFKPYKVGDYIEAEFETSPVGKPVGDARIVSILPRKSLITRPEYRVGTQNMAANVDICFLVVSANADFSVNRIEADQCTLRFRCSSGRFKARGCAHKGGSMFRPE